MFDATRYIPWTPRHGRNTTLATTTPATTATATNPQVCPRTLHIARAIVAHAVEPFPEAARAISAAFLAYIRGGLTLNLTGDPATWAVIAIPTRDT
jgi:hypothetical protein